MKKLLSIIVVLLIIIVIFSLILFWEDISFSDINTSSFNKSNLIISHEECIPVLCYGCPPFCEKIHICEDGRYSLNGRLMGVLDRKMVKNVKKNQIAEHLRLVGQEFWYKAQEDKNEHFYIYESEDSYIPCEALQLDDSIKLNIVTIKDLEN